MVNTFLIEGDIIEMKTLGKKPILAKVLEYYDRKDVRGFIYQAFMKRKVSMSFAAVAIN